MKPALLLPALMLAAVSAAAGSFESGTDQIARLSASASATARGAMAAFRASRLGLPDEDPVIKDMRARFEAGKAPSADQLLGKSFTCVLMAATKGNMVKREQGVPLTFTAFDGYLIQNLPGFFDDNLYHVITAKELIGTKSSGDHVYTSAYRIDAKGFLVSEYSGTGTPPIAELDPLAAAPAGSKVLSYILCLPKP